MENPAKGRYTNRFGKPTYRRHQNIGKTLRLSWIPLTDLRETLSIKASPRA